MNDTKLHVQYSDGSGKDMDMPPATSLKLPITTSGRTGYVTVYHGNFSLRDKSISIGGKVVWTQKTGDGIQGPFEDDGYWVK